MRDAMPLTSSLPGSTEVGVVGEDNPGHARHAVRHSAGKTRCDTA